jgi:hypothetical protein
MWADHEVQHADNIQADISLIESKTESAGKAAQHPTSVAHAGDIGPELIMELAALTEKLDVQGQLSTFGGALQVIESRNQKDDHFYLLELNPRNKQLNVTAFRASGSEAAESAYLDAEKRMRVSPGAQAVLVSVDRITSLRRAYPNYFLDTGNFVSLLNDALSGRKLKAPNPKLSGDLDQTPPLLKGIGIVG